MGVLSRAGALLRDYDITEIQPARPASVIRQVHGRDFTTTKTKIALSYLTPSCITAYQRYVTCLERPGFFNLEGAAVKVTFHEHRSRALYANEFTGCRAAGRMLSLSVTGFLTALHVCRDSFFIYKQTH